MWIRTFYFLSLLFLVLTLGAALAHAYSLPVKMAMSRAEYFAAQQVYRGWALTGIAMAGALVSSTILCVLLRSHGSALRLAVVTPLAIVASLAIFFLFTEPANRQTDYWTVAPPNWEKLRAQWEYSHAAGAALELIAFATLVLSLFTLMRPLLDRS